MKLCKIQTATALALSFFVSSFAHSERYYADYFFLPPPEESAEEGEETSLSKRYPLPEATTRRYAALSGSVYELDIFDIQSSAAKTFMDTAPFHQVAAGDALALMGDALFALPVEAEDGYVFLATLSSRDAYALRLKVDLGGLRHDECLWLLDAQGEAAFGPYTSSSDAAAQSIWLQTTIGDTVVLAATSPRDTPPLIEVVGASHFYKPVFKQYQNALTCNVPIASEQNSALQQLASGVGMLLIPFGYNQGFCTGTLVNQADNHHEAPEPYLLTAWHCLGDSVNYSGIEVYWDYRADNPTDGVPAANQRGAALIDANEVLDAALLRLTSMPAPGIFGRAWAGWDTRIPEVDQSAQGMHYPMAEYLSLSQGKVSETGVEVCMNSMCSMAYEQQIRIYWSRGVTEPGSSGSALFMLDGNFRMVGMLSNGTAHRCDNISNNYDNYASFSLFFPQIGCHLVSGYACGDAYESTRKGCFLGRMFKLSVAEQHNLRRFRGEFLGKTAWGRQLVSDYYALAPSLERWFEKDGLARTLFAYLLNTGIALGGVLE